MKKAIVELTSVSPYSQSRFHNTPKLDKELPDDYEKRTWMEKGHYNDDGYMIIPPMALANSIKESAKYLSIQIQGKGKATYTKNFEAGVLVTDQIVLPVTRDTCHQNWVYCNADGRKNSGTRVMRAFPTCLKWQGTITYHILDDIITQPIFEQVLSSAGSLIGIGQFRPRNGGYFGRYSARIIDFIDG